MRIVSNAFVHFTVEALETKCVMLYLYTFAFDQNILLYTIFASDKNCFCTKMYEATILQIGSGESIFDTTIYHLLNTLFESYFKS